MEILRIITQTHTKLILNHIEVNNVSRAFKCKQIIISMHSIRSPGSAAVNMCLVACGSADAYYHMGIHCWDMAGGAAVVTEAGGVIMDISGGPFDLMSRRLIIASSRAIAERIAKEITEFDVGRDDTDG